MTKAIPLAMIVRTILISNLDYFFTKGMPCRSSHLGSSQYASFNAIHTNYFISTLRCNLLRDLHFRGEARTVSAFVGLAILSLCSRQ